MGDYVEAESGKGADALDSAPQLAAALAAARSAKCPLIEAKLDRLSRDVAFVSGLMAQRVPFIVAELALTPTHSCSTWVSQRIRALAVFVSGKPAFRRMAGTIPLSPGNKIALSATLLPIALFVIAP